MRRGNLTVISGIELVAGVFAALTSVRMWRSGLHRRYPFLFAYLVFQVPYSIWPAIMDIHSRGYFWVWVFSEPVSWIFEIAVVRELCGLVLERYRGYAVWAVGPCMGVWRFRPPFPWPACFREFPVP